MPHVQISHSRRPRHCLVLQRILEFSILMKVTMMMVMVLMLVLIETGTGIGTGRIQVKPILAMPGFWEFFVRQHLPYGYCYHSDQYNVGEIFYKCKDSRSRGTELASVAAWDVQELFPWFGICIWDLDLFSWNSRSRWPHSKHGVLTPEWLIILCIFCPLFFVVFLFGLRILGFGSGWDFGLLMHNTIFWAYLRLLRTWK